uniref:Odorant receptor n=1 Tax=Plectus sambesii TaxID=2011161 RepID=A0A914W5Q1_9BILA
MPFVEIDWSRFNNSRHDGRALGLPELLAYITRPSRLLLTFIGAYLDYPLPKKPALRRLAVAHIVLVSILAVFVSCPVVLSTRFLPIFAPLSLSSAKTIALILLHWQTVVAFIFLIIWQTTKAAAKIRDLQSAASTGVGLLRRKLLVTQVYRAAFGSTCVLAGAWIAYLATSYLTDLLPPPFIELLFTEILDPLVFATSALLLVTWSVAQVTVIFYLTIIAVEFRALHDDIADDGNLYQSPVTKHYVLVHSRLRKMLDHFNLVASWFMLCLVTTAVVGLFVLVLAVFEVDNLDLNEKETLVDIGVSLGLTLTFLTQLIAIIVFSLIVHHEVHYIASAVGMLIASERNLHDQTYSVAIAYLQHFWRQSPGVSLGGIAVINKRLVVGLLLFLLLAATRLLGKW